MRRYPDSATERDRFVIEHRPPRIQHDAWRSHGVIFEDERTSDGDIARVATVFLTGRECPWHCAMCDLWQFTNESASPPGALSAQAADARRRIDAAGSVTQVKLYNAGSFFDTQAVPLAEYDGMAASTAGLARVIVESHPLLVGDRTTLWIEAMARHVPAGVRAPTLEVSLGLETAHEVALERLNKRASLEEFASAAAALIRMGADVRVFLLVSPPFVPHPDQDEWLLRSVAASFAMGARTISLIPTRAGNGTLEALAREELFHLPTLDDLERSLSLALASGRPTGARVFADTWDLERFASCAECLPARRTRLQRMNLLQQDEPAVECAHCTAPTS